MNGPAGAGAGAGDCPARAAAGVVGCCLLTCRRSSTNSCRFGNCWVGSCSPTLGLLLGQPCTWMLVIAATAALEVRYAPSAVAWSCRQWSTVMLSMASTEASCQRWETRQQDCRTSCWEMCCSTRASSCTGRRAMLEGPCGQQGRGNVKME
jgi:hypothetical protein